ncbi:response regulator receiver modulated diguanylate cyclase [Desulfatibacillum aliphaticivorans]|uniref:diguanylate cyclase n=1 Tax=Desulfatibacillum aliphaticivorans TaxID=218208 RepID=B8FLU3_DESAL|nr:diguanylate cyclase [Desulfatibacillum aliphaticivorans]ACL05447.1 response regulator receiver modulated diguanylate cyclase [Desulfatibacillum aliphaticivorans]
MKKVLLVEDSPLFGDTVKAAIEDEFECQVMWAQTMADAQALLEKHNGDFCVSVLDYNLPDASDGEILDCVLAWNIPSIVFSGIFEDDARDFIWSKRVVDYVLKGGPESIEYLISLIRHIFHARETKVLVVDDSRVFRAMASELLSVRQYQIFQAENGREALEIMEEHPDIRMAIIDYYMPEMDGITLTNELRRRYNRDQLAIIGVSTEGGGMISAQFIKSGANDFLNKPFLTEEFYCRITQNIDLLRHIKRVKELSSRDYLTNLFNRRSFFEYGQKLYASAMRDQTVIAVAMLDVDEFKSVNDSFGHDAGDEVLKTVADTLMESFRETDIVSRFGGDEFCIIMANPDKNEVPALLERIRTAVENKYIEVDGQQVNVSISVGACTELCDSLDIMIKKADQMLRQAKRAGKNNVQLISAC